MVIQINGPAGVGKKRLLRHACAQAGITLHEIDVAQVLRLPDRDEILEFIPRAAVLNQHAVSFTNLELLAEPSHENSANILGRELRADHLIAFLPTPEKVAPGKMDDFDATIELPPLDVAARSRIWTELLTERDTAEDISVREFARTFPITGAPLHRAVRFAAGQARLRAESQTIQRGDLLQACRRETTGRMNELAVLVHPRFTWDDLIMSKQTKSLLHEVENAVNDRRIVYEQWTMHSQGTAEQGMSILFTGPPGTGKTMAASIIARELGLELYKLDLSRVVSKYVGETEKNLSIVFNEAEKANAVLFFDEADSLFGKRGDIKSAQDHYVNQQVGFLLQKVESFQGIAFLATNLDDNMDKAFERRFSYIVRFRVPRALERTEIWKRSFSPATPLADDVDFEALGKDFNATGAQIKNIARNAAFLAAADKTREKIQVHQSHILHATLREFDKETIA